MHNLESQILDISKTKSQALRLSENLQIGDLILLQGDLGTGKTTFARFIINNLFLFNKLEKPSAINSPTYPILITYKLPKYELHHYDLYRIRSISELEELDFFENFNSTITLIEWPELLIDLPLTKNIIK